MREVLRDRGVKYISFLFSGRQRFGRTDVEKEELIGKLNYRMKRGWIC